MKTPEIYLTTPTIDAHSEPAALCAQLSALIPLLPCSALRIRLSPSDERNLVRLLKPFTSTAQNCGVAAILDIVAEPVALAEFDLARIASRGGADGVHLRDLAAARAAIAQFAGTRAVGLANPRTRHDAMEAGEAGVDYLVFGEPRVDGSMPPFDVACERASWWAEIFETPCAIFLPDLGDIDAALATGAEFLAVGDAIFAHPDGPEAGALALAAVLQARREQ
ncbi:MAG: thiamine phosphate synthase [Salinarimonas sp.]|nr:thiamine phosphate synthase [Salinarimonas sp.]